MAYLFFTDILPLFKPEFADKILSGDKRYEFRKVLFKKNVDTIVIYATMPVGKIIGEFKVEDILQDKPASLWDRTKEYSGITQGFFNQYLASFKTTLHFFSAFPICRAFSKKTVRYFGAHMKDAQYFKGKSKAFAIQVKNPSRYREPFDLKKLLHHGIPPQSFCYLS